MKPVRMVVPLVCALLFVLSGPAPVQADWKVPNLLPFGQKAKKAPVKRSTRKKKKDSFIQQVTHLVPGMDRSPSRRSRDMNPLEKLNANTRRFFVESTRKTKEALTTSTEHTKQFFSKTADVLISPWILEPEPQAPRSVSEWMSQDRPGF